MTEQITLTLPEDISARVRQIAETTSQPVEQIVLDHLKSLSIQLPPLPPFILNYRGLAAHSLHDMDND
jgi:stage III sporulation protein SpoIIIAA